MKIESKGLKLEEHFSDLKDPRMQEKIAHSLYEIIVIMICAVISGADTYVDVEQFGKAKEKWLRTFLNLSNGIPSHDTIGRALQSLNPRSVRGHAPIAPGCSVVQSTFRSGLDKGHDRRPDVGRQPGPSLHDPGQFGVAPCRLGVRPAFAAFCGKGVASD